MKYDLRDQFEQRKLVKKKKMNFQREGTLMENPVNRMLTTICY